MLNMHQYSKKETCDYVAFVNEKYAIVFCLLKVMTESSKLRILIGSKENSVEKTG